MQKAASGGDESYAGVRLTVVRSAASALRRDGRALVPLDLVPSILRQKDRLAVHGSVLGGGIAPLLERLAFDDDAVRLTFAGSIQEVVCNPEIKICIFSVVKPIAQAFLSQIKEEF